MQLQLYIGNKNYSSWSMRPWILMRHAGIPFEEIRVRFDAFEEGSEFKRRVGEISPAGLVPVLLADGFPIWDTLAIAEFLAETHPGRGLWPEPPLARARARSLAAEMHGGFSSLRGACPMNIEASLPEVGARVLAEQPGVARDLARIVSMWTGQLEQSGGPGLFGAFGIVDCFYAPVASRIRTYALPVPEAVQAYIERLFALPAVQDWVRDALDEHDFVAFDEPYRSR